MKVRKKPIEVAAWPVRELVEKSVMEWDALPQPIQDAYTDGKLIFTARTIDLETWGTWRRAGMDDYIIYGIDGELYQVSPEIFEKTYEPAGLNGWISCKDRLPDENSDVLAVVNLSEIHLVNFWIDYEGYKHWTEDGNATYEDSAVTHWRPRPELPEVAE